MAPTFIAEKHAILFLHVLYPAYVCHAGRAGWRCVCLAVLVDSPGGGMRRLCSLCSPSFSRLAASALFSFTHSVARLHTYKIAKAGWHTMPRKKWCGYENNRASPRLALSFRDPRW